MSDLVTFEVESRIGVLQLDHPPVNALSPALAVALNAALDRADNTPDIDALVLCCAGRTFVAGADIAAFEAKDFRVEPIVELIARLEASRTPVIAALHGTALGGGLELALGCHWRVAHPKARVGLPEVKLGLLPGAGGTQRLPRLVGVPFALDLILTGRHVGAEEALKAGIIDEISEKDPREAGLDAAKDFLKYGRSIRRTSSLPLPACSPDVLAEAAAAAAKKPAYPAMAAIVRCVRAAAEHFESGAALEKDEFITLLRSPQSAALRHLFFAERQAAKIPKLPAGLAEREIKRVGVIGAGTMGGGIAMNFVNAGIPTVIIEASAQALARGVGTVRSNYQASAAKGRMTQYQVDRSLGILNASLDFADLGDCDLVIEAVYENLDLKRDICARLGAILKVGSIIATNTSTLDVDVLAEASGRPADVVGMHFFSPANVMRLLEIVRGAKTAPDVLAAIVRVSGKIGKVPVVAGVCYGFIGNRMAEVYMREAEFLMMEGAEPHRIDAAVESLGMAMGPCRMLDMAGVDVGAKTVIEWKKSGGAPKDPSYRAVVHKLFESGRFGQKTGAGYYRYEGRKPIPDPTFAELAGAVRAAHGIRKRDDIPAEEIVERLLYPLINEGYRILGEGIAYRPGDIDVVWAAGYGFPDHTGGPMFWATKIGLPHIADRLAHYAQVRGNDYGYWTPAPLLLESARTSSV